MTRFEFAARKHASFTVAGIPANDRIPDQSSAGTLLDSIAAVIHALGPLAGSKADVEAAAEAVGLARDAALASDHLVADLMGRIHHLERLTVQDELTGLINRRGFTYAVDRALADAGRHGEPGAMIYIDLDGLKRVNDKYGHAAGDKLIGEAAARLAAHIRTGDTAARLGGDEFAVLLPRISAADASLKAEEVCERLNTGDAEYGHVRLPVAASVGVHFFGPGTDADALLAEADRAMYAIKRERRRRAEAAEDAAARSDDADLRPDPEILYFFEETGATCE